MHMQKAAVVNDIADSEENGFTQRELLGMVRIQAKHFFSEHTTSYLSEIASFIRWCASIARHFKKSAKVVFTTGLPNGQSKWPI